MMKHGKAFPHRIVAMINDAGYEQLKEESLARGYQVALIERWMLIPPGVESMYAGSLDDVEEMMRRPLPSGNTKDRGPKRTCRNIWLTDAGWEAVTRCAAKCGLVRSAYVAETIHAQIRLATDANWAFPDGITNESVEKEIRDVLRKMEEPATAGGME